MATNPFAGLESLATGSIEYAVGFGLGIALGRALGPLAVTIEQEAFAADPSRALDPETAAQLAAQRLVALAWGESEAAASGINAGKFDLLEQLQLRAPALGELVTLLRRSAIAETDVQHALEKAQLEPRWSGIVKALVPVALEPAELAKAIHRGIMRSDGLLVAVPPTAPGKVPQVPESTLDPVEQAAWAGVTAEQLRVMVGNAGLPPGIVQMLELLNRGEITEDDFLRGVAESNLRNEWGPAIVALRRRLLTPHEYAEADLRGVLTPQEAQAGAALSGLDAADYATLFATVGRPLNVHAITTGLARGGTYGGTYADVPQPYRDAIRRSATRPEYAVLAHANRYSYPSGFQIKSEAPAIGKDRTEQLLLEVGWSPQWAAFFSGLWASGGAGTSAGKQETLAELADEYEGGFIAEPEFRSTLETLGYAGHTLDLLVHLGDARRAKRYREKVVDAIAAAYVAFRLSDVAATAELAKVNVTGEAASSLVALWGLQRLDTIRTLTPAQVKKAHKDGLLTDAAALQALEWLHYSTADAETFLAE